MKEQKKQEMRQTLYVCVSTLYRLNGRMPAAAELYTALGSEYAQVLAEYTEGEESASRFIA